MNSIYDKLKLFNEVILKDAALERNRILSQLKIEMAERISLEKKKYQEEIDELNKKEITSIENEKNNIISKALIESRQRLMKTREEIMKTISADTRKLLRNFTAGEDYFPYLCEQIRKCSKTAGGGESSGGGESAGEGQLVVYLNKNDMVRFSDGLENLKAELPKGSIIEEIGENAGDIIGGCLVLNRTEDFMVNGTLLEKLESSMDSFFIDFGDLDESRWPQHGCSYLQD